MIVGMGIVIEYSSTATFTGSPTWTAVDDITDVTPPTGGEANDVDVTVHSTTSKRKKYQSGLIEPGEWEFKTIMSKAAYASLLAFKGVTKGWRVTFSDGSKYESESYLKNDKIESPMGGVNEVTWTLKLAGEELFTPAT